MNNDKLISQLLRFYVILFPIKILNLPYIGDKLQKLQPADMLFLIILAVSIFQLPKLKLISLRNFDKAILFWLFAHLTTCLFHPTRPALIECIGTIYLVLLYIVINIAFASKTKDEIREWLFKSIELSAFCLMFFGLLGIFLALLGYPSMLSGKWGNFPYFGTIYRMLGLTAQPIMFASIGGISLLILITAFNSKKYTEMSSFSKTTLLLLGLGLPLTFAKSLVISYFCSAALVLDSYSKKYRKYIPFVFALALGFYIFINKNKMCCKYVE